MTNNPTPSHAVAEQQLQRRAAELRDVLQDAAGAAVHATDEAAELSDFKELADDEAQDTVRDATTEHALRELRQVEAALRRIREGSYGQCVQCGEAIAPARLQAVPAASLCATCQAQQERQAAHRA